MKVDIKIIAGTIIDPYRNLVGPGEILIQGRRIVAAETNAEVEAERVVYADDCIVVPGLIDFHAHLYPFGTEIGISPDASFLPVGVTTAVDGGSCGTANFTAFARSVVPVNRMRIFSLLNVCPAGLATSRHHEQADPKYYDEAKMKDLFDRHAGLLLGLKIRQSKDIVGELGLKPLEATLAIAQRLNCPVVVHTTNPPVAAEKIADILRKGDVYCHVHQGTGENILDGQGKVKQAFFAAQNRGVLFDAANGRNHFLFPLAKQAIREKFYPDIISSDITANTVFGDYVYGLPYVLTKYLTLGMELKTVIAACTSVPADWLGQSGKIGTLAPGAFADVAIFRRGSKPITIKDNFGNAVLAENCLVPQATILDGKIVFRQIDF